MRNLPHEVSSLLASINATASLMSLWVGWEAVRVEVMLNPGGGFQVVKLPCDRVITDTRCDLVNPDTGNPVLMGQPFWNLETLVDWLRAWDAQLNRGMWSHINAYFDDEVERLYDSGR